MNGYPKKFYSWFIYTAILLWITGLLLIPSTLMLRFNYIPIWQLSEHLKHHTTTIHAILAFVTLWFLGAIWSIHMRSGWRKKKNRRSGAMLMTTLIVIIFTGLGIYYLGDEQLANLTSISHFSLGCLSPILLIIHIMLGKKNRVSNKRT